MPFAYYSRLSDREKRIYRASDEIGAVGFPMSFALEEAVRELAGALESGSRPATQKAAQALADGLTGALEVPGLRVEVREQRPSWSTGELHGLYRPGERGFDRVSLWMRTARRAQVVKFRTFVRTLLHELCHHLDYARFGLEESFHTEGFYKRESSLLHQLLPAAAEISSQQKGPSAAPRAPFEE